MTFEPQWLPVMSLRWQACVPNRAGQAGSAADGSEAVRLDPADCRVSGRRSTPEAADTHSVDEPKHPGSRAISLRNRIH
jgi:hypothetical protein